MLILKKGSTGPSVRLLQERLTKKGFLTGPIDGDFGKQTDTAVRQFQAANNLKVDGIVGDRTWALLLSDPVAAPTDAIDEQRQWLREQIDPSCLPNQGAVLDAARACIGFGQRHARLLNQPVGLVNQMVAESRHPFVQGLASERGSCSSQARLVLRSSI